jgi:hypothetical protein
MAEQVELGALALDQSLQSVRSRATGVPFGQMSMNMSRHKRFVNTPSWYEMGVSTASIHF